MRFVIYGAGAIGGVIGGRLFEHGHDVVLIARGPHLDAIRSNGLQLETPTGSTTLPIPAVGHISELTLDANDVVVFAMKSQHTADAARALADVAPADITVVSAQNGVENERFLLRLFTDVLAICVMCPTCHLEPGVVEAYSNPVTGLLDIGRWVGGVDDRTRAIAAALNASTFESEPRDDIARWKYGKLLMNLGNAVEALCGPAERGGEVMRLARREAVSVLTTAGIDFVDRDEDRARRGDRLTIEPIEGRPRGGGSSWQSLQRGTGNIEVDYLNGEIVLLGRLHGIATPVNELLQRRAQAAARDGLEPGSTDPAELLAEIETYPTPGVG